MSCGYASGWQGWVQLENFSAWNGVPFATENNGFGGPSARLEFNKPLQVKHIQLLSDMLKKAISATLAVKMSQRRNSITATVP